MDFAQDWLIRQLEVIADGAMRKLMDKPTTQEHHDVWAFGADDLIHYRLCALLEKMEFCAAEDLLWEYLQPGQEDALPLAEDFYRRLGAFRDDTLEAHEFSRPEVESGLLRAREFLQN